MKTRYLLATSGGMLTFLKKFNENPGLIYDHCHNLKKDMRFYKRNPDGTPMSYFHHGELLFSALHFSKMLKDGKTLKDVMNFDEDNMIFVDSGGYSIATGVVSRDDWSDKQAFDISVQNGNIFPILDIPPVAGTDFEKCLQTSYESAQYYKANKPGNGEIILNVAHGRNLEETKRWTDKISKVKLDGWAVGSSHEGNPKQIIKGLFFMLTSGMLEDAKAFHVFGVSSASMCIYFAAIRHALRNHPKLKYNFDITFDSSYPLRGAAFGHMFLFTKFDGFTNVTLSNRVDWSTLSNDDFQDGFFCDCDVCRNITDFRSMMTNEKTMEFNIWMSLHNTCVMKKYINQVSSLAEMCMDVDGLLQLKYKDKKGEDKTDHPIFPAEVARNIMVIREAFDNIEIGEQIIDRKFIGADPTNSGATLSSFFE